MVWGEGGKVSSLRQPQPCAFSSIVVREKISEMESSTTCDIHTQSTVWTTAYLSSVAIHAPVDIGSAANDHSHHTASRALTAAATQPFQFAAQPLVQPTPHLTNTTATIVVHHWYVGVQGGEMG